MPVMRYREALNAALREEMQRDEDVFIMGEDIGVFNGAFKVTAGLLEEFGDKRVRDTPISENTIVGMGVGAAMGGLRPIVELMTINFSLLAMDQIVNHAATIHYMFGGQVRGWYSVDERSAGVHKGEDEREMAGELGSRDEAYKKTAESLDKKSPEDDESESTSASDTDRGDLPKESADDDGANQSPGG